MADRVLSRRTTAIMETESYGLVMGFMLQEYLPRVRAGDEIADFTFGNPHEMALPGVVEAFRTWIEPGNPDWFAYKTSEPRSQEIVAASLERFLGLPFEPADIAMTTGGFGALVTALKVVTDPGDEVIFSLPPWFGYEPMCVEAGVTPVKVRVKPENFDLDLEAIAAAITPRTRLLIVNTPQNPTGKVLPADTLARLADLLEDASRRNGRRIYLLSDEAYNRIVFNGARHRSPVEFYPWSFLAYSYGKTLLIPGMRVGYLAVPPTMPREEREQLREGIFTIQAECAWLFPNALLQHALADLDGLTLDLDHLRRKRDHMVGALRELGYDVHLPEGTFYLFPRSPIADDRQFARMLMDEGVFVMPGPIFETPGYFRICLTASDEMIERGLPGFARAIERAGSGQLAAATREAAHVRR